jgi:hypothetical protein
MSSQPQCNRRHRRRNTTVGLIWVGATALAFAFTTASFWPRVPVPEGRSAPPAPAATVPAAAAPVAVEHERSAVPGEPAPVPWTFEQYVEHLVELGLQTSGHAAAGRKDLATASDQEARRLFAEMLERIDDAPERALQVRSAAAAETVDPREALRQQVCTLAIDAGLQYRLARSEAGDPREPLDQLTAAILGVLPAGGVLADQLCHRFLIDRPYLAACHEPAVLDLMALAGEERFPRDLAASLLLTLWHNLEHTGVRSGDELAALALLLLDDAKAPSRLAACMQLLSVAGGRFRDVVLERVRASKDRELARDLCMAAAKNLPVAAALPVIEDLGRTGAETTGALLFAAWRDAPALIATYEHRLADGVNAAFRAELVTGLGYADTPDALASVRLAFRSDPDLNVRLRAMFALTGKTANALGEQALQDMLDDPRSGGDPHALGAVVSALQNLERAGLVNAVNRLGQRLRTCNLEDIDRQSLERLLARALPAGQR